MFSDALAITDMLLTSDEQVSYEGQHFQLDEALLLPPPARAGGPPILIGGNGPKRTLPMVARYAREWNAVFIDHETYKDRTDLLNGYLEENGRTAGEVKRSLMTRVLYGRTEADVKARAQAAGADLDEMRANNRVVGTPQEIVDRLGAWADLGVERFMLQWLELDDTEGMAMMAEDVLPHFHTT